MYFFIISVISLIDPARHVIGYIITDTKNEEEISEMATQHAGIEGASRIIVLEVPQTVIMEYAAKVNVTADVQQYFNVKNLFTKF